MCARPYLSLHEQINEPLFAQIFGPDEATPPEFAQNKACLFDHVNTVQRERLHELKRGLFSAPISVPYVVNRSVLALKTGPL